MKGVLFGNVHSYRDLKLILAPFTPPPAQPQTNFLTVPGRDGSLDLTEAHGEIKFNSREFEFTFTIDPAETKTFDEKVMEVSNLLNGARCKITLDRDPDYYWLGRCVIDKYTQDRRLGKITIKATVDPYKLKSNVTVTSVTLTSTEQNIALENGRMAAVPTITCTDDDTLVTFAGTTHRLEAGTYKILGIRFVEGYNNLTLVGSGTITFTWQEGEL